MSPRTTITSRPPCEIAVGMGSTKRVLSDPDPAFLNRYLGPRNGNEGLPWQGTWSGTQPLVRERIESL